MGISAVASYVGGALVDVDRPRRRPSSRAASRRPPPGRAGRRFADLAERQLRRREAALAIPEPAPGREARLPDPGFARFRADGEAHLFSPQDRRRDPGPAGRRRPGRHRPGRRRGAAGALPRGWPGDRAPNGPSRATSCGSGAVAATVPLVDVEDARSIVRRFVVSAMSVGRPEPGGAPGADHRHPAGRRRREHRRGRRGPGLVQPGPDGRRRDARIKQVASARFGVTADLPGPRRPARDQDRPGLQARRGRPAPGSQGHRLHRGAPARPARPELHQPAAAPRHLLDRGPRPAHRGPAGDQPGGPDRRQARRRSRASGRSPPASPRPGAVVHPPVRPRRRDRRLAAVVDQARRGAVGARPGRGPPGPPPQRPARPGRAAHGRRPADRPRPARRRAARRRGVRVRDRGARRDRLRHGPPVPPRHVPDRHRHPARGPAGQVHAARPRRRRALLPGPRRGPPPRAGGGRCPVRRRDRRGEPPAACAPIPAARAELAPVIGAAPWGADAARRADPAQRRPRARAARPPSAAGGSGSRPPSAARARSRPPGSA